MKIVLDYLRHKKAEKLIEGLEKILQKNRVYFC